MNSSASTRLLLIAAIVFLASCTASEKTATQTYTPSAYTPPTNFDASSYINPQEYGYDLMGSSKDVAGIADTSFTPIQYDERTAQRVINYPSRARRNGIQGKVVLEIYIDSTGTLKNIKVIESPHSLLTESSKDAVTQTNYTPAILNGKSVNSFLRVPSRFQVWSSGN